MTTSWHLIGMTIAPGAGNIHRRVLGVTFGGGCFSFSSFGLGVGLFKFGFRFFPIRKFQPAFV